LPICFAVCKGAGSDGFDQILGPDSGIPVSLEDATMDANRTLPDLIASGRDGAVAFAAEGAPPLTYAALRALLQDAEAALSRLGIGRGDRVGIVLANGPEVATAFLAVASTATAAPLNPAYREDEFEFYLKDLDARALIVEKGAASPAIIAAEKLGVAVIALAPEPRLGAGWFAVEGSIIRGAGRRGPPEGEDVALILHTSGTTSRPKIVPLKQSNLWTSARNVAATLDLSERDRGLNIMPLFHIHGLVAGLLAPLSRGGSVHCARGFNALKFFEELETADPSWYTAVPTMHQAILMRAGHHQDVIARRPLRFIRSSSSSLPPQVIAELEAVFRAPVIEAYGMTEATHQMASNPLHGPRKPGSVGLAQGQEIAIMDEVGGLLGTGTVGEVVIRGENVMGGYENNAKANAEAFVNGWFRTGDQGVIDADGYLTLTGRLKEIINRGGEKISPREVDEALMDHPAVLQAIAFAVPHELLGEDVGAAVVLREGIQVSEKDLRAFLMERLAAFKAPRRILFLSEIPKGTTGKLQRIGLAEKLGLGRK
jgi:acyl-CoA synthetase (AMP-forming)/AMP-acid ligase II